ncbi:hypothetical protein KEJ18_04140 [Candidatus Bathyarchaeota archaeon]|nr:hypothetical protein [Candidatus Bathyarchaeota archaeon]
MKKQAVIQGVAILIVGAIIGGFGYADIEYYITELPYEIDLALYYIGSLISFIGFVYLIYGIVAKGPQPPPRTVYVPTPTPAYAPVAAPQPQPQVPRCPTCGQPLELIQQYNRWYCRTCQKYV